MAFFDQKRGKSAKNRAKIVKNREKIGIFAKKSRFSLKSYTKILLYKKFVVILHCQIKKHKFNNQNLRVMKTKKDYADKLVAVAKMYYQFRESTFEEFYKVLIKNKLSRLIEMVDKLNSSENEGFRRAYMAVLLSY